MPLNGKRKLKDIEPDEISLVDAGANRTPFSIIKRRQSAMKKKLIELYKKLMGEDAPEKLVKSAIPDERGNELTAAMETIQKYQDDLPDEILDAAKTLTKMALNGPEDEGEAEGDKPVDVEKIGARLSKATKEQLTKIKEMVDRMLQADRTEDADKADVKKYEGLPAEAAERLRKLDKIERDEQDAMTKASKKREDDRDELIKGLNATIKTLNERLDKVEKARGIKKSADGQDGTDLEKKGGKPDSEEKAPLWPSLAGPDED